MNEELIYLMCLTCTLPYQSQVQRQLLEAAGSAKALYEARHNLYDILPEASKRLAELIPQMESYMKQAEAEMAFAEKGHIRIISSKDADYPARMHECPDAPILLYYRGTADLNSRHMLSIVGTRQATHYGQDFCQRFLSELARLCPDTIVVSGLAYGIDIQAHRHSLKPALQISRQQSRLWMSRMMYW